MFGQIPGENACIRVTSLPHLIPPPTFERPSKKNSTCFLLRSSTDGSLIRSVQGYKGHQCWSSSPKGNLTFEDALLHHDHVFFIFLYGSMIWGVARMSSPEDAKEYGPVSLLGFA